MFAVEPIFTALHFALAFNQCLLTTDFYSEYNSIVDHYFPNWGFDLEEIINAAEEDEEDAEERDDLAIAKDEEVKKPADKDDFKAADKDTKKAASEE